MDVRTFVTLTIMKKVVLLHGKFSEKLAALPEVNPNDERNWMGWTKKQLLERGYQAIAPVVPRMWDAPYSEWEKVLEEAGIDGDTVLVGLSAGGAACVRYITEKKKDIDKLILVAASLYDPDDSVKDHIKNGTTVFISDDEIYPDVLDAVKTYEKKLDANVIRFEDRGHFSFLIKTFPELLEEITK